jgi:hypothetical protein
LGGDDRLDNKQAPAPVGFPPDMQHCIGTTA